MNATKRRCLNDDAAIEYPCISCQKEVRPRQHALMCDGCSRWQHRTCSTGVTQQEYRLAVQKKTSIDWKCSDCLEEPSTSTPPATLNITYTIVPATPTSPDFDTSVVQQPSPLSSTFRSPPTSPASTNASIIQPPSPLASTSATSPLPVTAPTSPDINQLPDRSVTSFQEPPAVVESNLNSTITVPSTDSATDTDEVPEFQVIVGASIRGADILVEKSSYTYVKDGKPAKNGRQRWRCSIRNKGVSCTASVSQAGDVYTRGPHPHKCSARDCADITMKVKAQLRKKPFDNTYQTMFQLLAYQAWTH